MKKILLDKLRGSLTAKSACLLLLIAVIAVPLTTSLSSFALSSKKGGAPSSAGSSKSKKSSKSAIVKTTKVVPTPGGKSETILINAKSLTLYYFTSDKGTTSACTGACLTHWPPLLFAGNGVPSASVKLPGKLTVAKNANGQQVLYNGYLLYTYDDDKAINDIKGNKEGGKWFIVPTTLKPKAAVPVPANS